MTFAILTIMFFAFCELLIRVFSQNETIEEVYLIDEPLPLQNEKFETKIISQDIETDTVTWDVKNK